MAEESKGKVFKISKIEDLEFVVGGANVAEKIDDNLLQTSRTQMCNCGEFEPLRSGVTLNICDNCKWAQAVADDSGIVYCSKQKMKSNLA